MKNTANQPDGAPLDVPDDESGYRSLSLLAVLSFALGMFSLLALISPVFWIIPLVAALVAWAAIRAVRTDSTKSGQRLAKIGMFVAVCVGLWAVSYHFSREWYLFRTARRFADEWLEVVESGNLYEAHQLHLPFLERFADKDKLEEFYDSAVEMADTPSQFFDEKPLDELVKNFNRGKVEYVGRKSHTTFGQSDFLALTYALKYDNNSSNDLLINIQLERIWNYNDGRHYWRVEFVKP